MQGTVIALAQRPVKGAEMTTCEHLNVSRTEGVVGDHGASWKRQVSLLDEAAWNVVCESLGHDLPWTVRRSNILIQGIDLPRLVGQNVSLGTAEIEVVGEVTPCHLMDAVKKGLKDALATEWRGGVYGRVIESGVVQIGDKISPIER